MWSVVLLFLGLMKAASYVAGATVDEKSGTSMLRTSCVLLIRQLLRLNEHNDKITIACYY